MDKLVTGFGLLCLAGIGSALAGQSSSPLAGLLVLIATLTGLWYLLAFLRFEERK